MIDSSKIGSLELSKGFVRKDIMMFAWDGIRECTRDECPVVDQCKYIHSGRCSVQVQYVESLYKAILSTYSYLDETMLFKIGMEVIPLYTHLVRLQIIELSLTTPMTESAKGTAMVHPVYKEIRETLKTIGAMWKGLDLAFMFGEKAKLTRKGAPDDPKVIDNERGDPDFYKKISAEGPSQKGKIR
jgi:hypothetical protein